MVQSALGPILEPSRTRSCKTLTKPDPDLGGLHRKDMERILGDFASRRKALALNVLLSATQVITLARWMARAASVAVNPLARN